MKPVVTWVLLANAGMARVVVNRGPSKGFAAMGGKTWRAEKPIEYADKPGVERRENTYGSVTLDSGDPKDAAESAFAQDLASRLSAYCRDDCFDRLIISAAPSLLGKLRAALPENVREKVSAEVDKDLTQVGVDDLAAHLKDVIAA